MDNKYNSTPLVPPVSNVTRQVDTAKESRRVEQQRSKNTGINIDAKTLENIVTRSVSAGLKAYNDTAVDRLIKAIEERDKRERERDRKNKEEQAITRAKKEEEQSIKRAKKDEEKSIKDREKKEQQDLKAKNKKFTKWLTTFGFISSAFSTAVGMFAKAVKTNANIADRLKSISSTTNSALTFSAKEAIETAKATDKATTAWKRLGDAIVTGGGNILRGIAKLTKFIPNALTFNSDRQQTIKLGNVANIRNSLLETGVRDEVATEIAEQLNRNALSQLMKYERFKGYTEEELYDTEEFNTILNNQLSSVLSANNDDRLKAYIARSKGIDAAFIQYTPEEMMKNAANYQTILASQSKEEQAEYIRQLDNLALLLDKIGSNFYSFDEVISNQALSMEDTTDVIEAGVDLLNSTIESGNDDIHEILINSHSVGSHRQTPPATEPVEITVPVPEVNVEPTPVDITVPVPDVKITVNQQPNGSISVTDTSGSTAYEFNTVLDADAVASISKRNEIFEEAKSALSGIGNNIRENVLDTLKPNISGSQILTDDSIPSSSFEVKPKTDASTSSSSSGSYRPSGVRAGAATKYGLSDALNDLKKNWNFDLLSTEELGERQFGAIKNENVRNAMAAALQGSGIFALSVPAAGLLGSAAGAVSTSLVNDTLFKNLIRPSILPGYANGGVGTVETVATLFEHDKAEAVIPLETQAGIDYLSNAMKQAGGTGTTINATVQLSGINIADNERQWNQVAENIGNRIATINRRTGGL